MQILVDADACPVKQIIIQVAKEYKLPVTMFIDTSQKLNDGYSEMVTVDKQRDSADIALINQSGMIYSLGNIDRLLFERHLS